LPELVSDTAWLKMIGEKFLAETGLLWDRCERNPSHIDDDGFNTAGFRIAPSTASSKFPAEHRLIDKLSPCGPSQLCRQFSLRPIPDHAPEFGRKLTTRTLEIRRNTGKLQRLPGQPGPKVKDCSSFSPPPPSIGVRLGCCKQCSADPVWAIPTVPIASPQRGARGASPFNNPWPGRFKKILPPAAVPPKARLKIPLCRFCLFPAIVYRGFSHARARPGRSERQRSIRAPPRF